MADNVVLNSGSGGDTVRALDKGGIETQVIALDIGGTGAESLVTANNPMPVIDDGSRNLLHRILMMLMAPLGYDKNLQRQRGTVIVESGTIGSVTFAANQDIRNVTTLAAVTSLNGINGRNADMLLNADINTAWALNVRARIT
jgi:hypothetical protein